MEFNATTCPLQSVGAVSQMYTLLIQTLVTAQCTIAAQTDWPESSGPMLLKGKLPEYDFIVVGAGTTGSVVASRLSENPKWKVLLLEAGGDPPIEAEIPNQFFTLKGTRYDWGYRTEPSPRYCKALQSGCYWPRGKMLGGSGSIGSMIYLRGFPMDFNQWADQGNLDWDYDTVLHYFKRAENNEDLHKLDPEYHSKNGALKIGSFKSNETMRNVFLEAAKEFNYELVRDFNGVDRIGYTYVQGTISNGIRQSSAKAYLSTVGKRPNLHVIKEAHVLKLEYDQQGDAVVGVRFNFNSTKEFRASSTKEVILSAGSINTPQILMLSGIGPSQELTKLRIKSRIDLAVGKNLQDHAIVMMFFRFNKHHESELSQDDTVNFFNYLYARSGPLAAPAYDLIGFINTKYWIDNHPDILFTHNVFPPRTESLPKFLSSVGLKETYIKHIANNNEGAAIGIVSIMLTNPFSKGKIILRNNNPVYKPKIMPNYFEEKDDVDSLVRGLQFYHQFVNTSAFNSSEGELIRFPIEECDGFRYASGKYWECYLTYFSTSLYHPVGTAKMGPRNDADTVVDNQLKVHSVPGLRVADASIMPTIPSGHTNAASIMIGERVVDFIKDDWV